jgi:hypothetical protein
MGERRALLQFGILQSSKTSPQGNSLWRKAVFKRLLMMMWQVDLSVEGGTTDHRSCQDLYLGLMSRNRGKTWSRTKNPRLKNSKYNSLSVEFHGKGLSVPILNRYLASCADVKLAAVVGVVSRLRLDRFPPS